jgi:hypothetical protein
MKINLRFSRKQTYTVYAALSAVLLGGVWGYTGNAQKVVAVVALLVVGLGSLFVQRRNLRRENFLYVLILPTHLAIGVILSVLYFPNLGLLVKVGSLVLIGAMVYAISLVNNIFLVVLYKQGMIPLYRAATTWLLILLVITAMPFYTGVLKLPLVSFIQMGIIGLSTLLFAFYTLWVTSLDVEANTPSGTESAYLAGFSAFLVIISGMAVSFIPTEPFLTALYISTFLMFVLGYLQAHLRNNITRRLVLEYVSIIITFFAILLLFKP